MSKHALQQMNYLWLYSPC